eukprot:385971_1
MAGLTAEQSEPKYCIKLLSKCGDFNGRYKYVQYFKCSAGYGAFVTKEEITCINKRRVNNNRIYFGTQVYIKANLNCVGTIIYIGPRTKKMNPRTQNYLDDHEYNVTLPNKRMSDSEFEGFKNTKQRNHWLTWSKQNSIQIQC